MSYQSLNKIRNIIIAAKRKNKRSLNNQERCWSMVSDIKDPKAEASMKEMKQDLEKCRLFDKKAELRIDAIDRLLDGENLIDDEKDVLLEIKNGEYNESLEDMAGIIKKAIEERQSTSPLPSKKF
jgi:hypothetical protein